MECEQGFLFSLFITAVTLAWVRGGSQYLMLNVINYLSHSQILACKTHLFKKKKKQKEQNPKDFQHHGLTTKNSDILGGR